MSLTVNSNLSSLYSQNAISSNQGALTLAMQRLATGLKINSAADNAAGYAISTRMTTQINGATQAASNANDAISLTQVAQGDLSSITGDLQQIRTLTVQAANGTNSASDRAALNNQAQQLIQEITRVASSSSFNGSNLLDGSFGATNFQVGASNSPDSTITINGIASATASALGSSVNSVTSAPITSSLAAGDLTLNGMQVGASTAGANPGQAANSAVQIAAAINLVSAQSGVVAIANPTVEVNNPPLTFTAIPASPTLTINGVAIGNISAGGTAAGQGANIAAAINLVSNQSGVIASANTATGAITLTAADGSNIVLGDQLAIAINPSSSLYTGSAPTVGTGTPPTAFTVIPASPSLTIDGIAVGTIAAGGTAAGQGANIAAAINLVSSQTGVTATADATTGAVSLTAANSGAIYMGTGWNQIGSGIGLGYSGNSVTGLPPTYFSVSPSGVGVNAPLQIFSSGFAGITGWAAGTNAVTQGANVAAAINLQTATTGVTATSSGSNGALTLTNTSGLPITIGGTSSVEAMTGLSLCPSSFAANNNNNVYGVTPTFGSNIAANAFQINGVSIGSITAGTSAASQAANVIAAINAISAKTGVTAAIHGGGSSPSSIMLNISGSTIIAVSGNLTNTGLTNSTSPINSVLNSAPTSFANIPANNITINGVPVGAVAAGTDFITQGANVAAAINLVSIQSGVTAVADITTGAITLSNTTGAGIFPATIDNPTVMASGLSTGYLINTGGPTGAGQANTNQVFYGTSGKNITTGTISLSSSTNNTITVGGGNVAEAGLTTGIQTTVANTSTLNNVNISTAAGAANALSVIDSALNEVNSSAASLGSYQNLFTYAITNLMTDNVNSTAARSRIMDADFAAETANLSRAQVIQQASTAMLAQANQSAQQVLSLLKQ